VCGDSRRRKFVFTVEPLTITLTPVRAAVNWPKVHPLPIARIPPVTRFDMTLRIGNTLHITSGDVAGESLAKAGLRGGGYSSGTTYFSMVPGTPDGRMKTLSTRALFLEEVTAGGLDRGRVLEALHSQYR
jgi:hypothetical protein